MSGSNESADIEANIETKEGGPFLVHGFPVRTADYVYSEQGEPMTWSFGDAVADGSETVALCRCGGSSDKPFCDGTHAERQWDSADAEQPSERYEARARRKETPDGVDYTLLDDTKLCTHAGFCGTERTTVWRMLPETTDTETLGMVMRMVEK